MIVEKISNLDTVLDHFDNEVDMIEHDDDMIKFVPAQKDEENN